MKIGLIGVGNIGGTLAKLFARAGHDVAISNSRGPDTLRELEMELGDRGRAVTAEEAAEFGDVVVVSMPFGRYLEVPTKGLAGKVVIDTNNYYPERDGDFTDLDQHCTTSSELLQAHLSDAHVVKAFNAMYYVKLRDRARPAGSPDRLGIPISGDDPEAKRVVTDLIDQIGFDAVDAGGLGEGGRRHEPGTAVYAQLLTAAQIREAFGI